MSVRPDNDHEFPRLLHQIGGLHKRVTTFEAQEAAIADGWDWRPVADVPAPLEAVPSDPSLTPILPKRPKKSLH